MCQGRYRGGSKFSEKKHCPISMVENENCHKIQHIRMQVEVKEVKL